MEKQMTATRVLHGGKPITGGMHIRGGSSEKPLGHVGTPPAGTLVRAFAGLPTPAARGTFAFALQSSSTSIDLDIFEEVGEPSFFSSRVSAKSVRDQLKGSGAKPINVKINSRGGDVFDGLAIYELLKEHPAPVTVDIDGIAASIASIIAMAGNSIRIKSSATLMIHDPWGAMAGSAQEFRKMADLLDRSRNTLADIYATRSRQPRERVLQLMRDETHMNAIEAQRLGFADEVR